MWALTQLLRGVVTYFVENMHVYNLPFLLYVLTHVAQLSPY